MEAPRALRKTENGEICEVDDPRARFIFCGQGTPLSAEDAKHVTEYLKAYAEVHAGEVKATEQVGAPISKMVEQSTVEDKAVAGPHEVMAPAPPPPPTASDDPGQTPAAPRPSSGRRGL